MTMTISMRAKSLAVIGAVLGFAMGVSPSFGAVTKNWLTDVGNPNCGGSWNPPCGEPPPPASRYCCSITDIQATFKNRRLVYVYAAACKRKPAGGAACPPGLAKVIDCTGMDVEQEGIHASGEEFALVCLNL